MDLGVKVDLIAAGAVDLIVKWICRGSGEMDLGVKLDLIAAGAGKAVAGFLGSLSNLKK